MIGNSLVLVFAQRAGSRPTLSFGAARCAWLLGARMKKHVLCLTLAAAIAAGMALPAPAQTQTPPTGGFKVGIINIQRAIVESTEGKKAADKLQTQFTPRRNELQTMQTDI